MNRIMHRALWLIACICLGLPASAQIVNDPRMFSFENEAELKYITAANGTDKLSTTHFKNGKKSLEWTFRPGGTLSVKKDLQFEPRAGRDNYLSAFIVWIYSEKPMSGNQLVDSDCMCLTDTVCPVCCLILGYIIKIGRAHV